MMGRENKRKRNPEKRKEERMRKKKRETLEVSQPGSYSQPARKKKQEKYDI